MALAALAGLPSALGEAMKGKKKPDALPELPGLGWERLFDGRTMKGWKICEEGELVARGDIAVQDGSLRLKAGMPFTAIKYANKFPTENYEIAVDARRVSGWDIFCGLTFPVGKGHVTLVCGGWGDTVVGLSSVDGENAANNETTRNIGFENDRWYRIRARVTTTRVQAWINEKQVVNLRRIGRSFNVYPQLEPLRPFGFFAWRTDAMVRNIRLRTLETKPLPKLPGKGWKPLFDGKTLKGWKVVAEGEEREKRMARAADGVVLCERGFELTGIAWEHDFPKTNYEVALDAMRVEGQDFFCGMTFPIGKQAATLIIGGWGGTVVGLSNVNDMSASENETSTDKVFGEERWYRIRLRVTDQKVQAWINAEQIINLPRKDRAFNVWLQQEAYLPFGLNAWQTQAAWRNIKLRRLEKEKK
jgi:hypothetical protein